MWRQALQEGAAVEVAALPSGSQAVSLNVSENCLDRHLGTVRANKAAMIFEGEPGDVRTLTYGQLHREVCRFANALTALGLVRGDRAAIYMPMVPEAAVAMLACARLGVIHTVIFGGFSSEAIKDRVNDCQAKLIITADGGWRRGRIVELKANVDRALPGTPSVRARDRAQAHRPRGAHGRRGATCWWHDLVAGQPARAQGAGLRQPRTPSSSSTPAAPRASPRACCTRRRATSSASP